MTSDGARAGACGYWLHEGRRNGMIATRPPLAVMFRDCFAPDWLYGSRARRGRPVSSLDVPLLVIKLTPLGYRLCPTRIA